jgi:hypothetical protein
MTKTAYPKSVEYHGNKAAIYLQKSIRYPRYEVRFYDVDGIQQRFTFTTSEAAKEFAEATVREIAQNRANFVTLRGPDAYDYQQVVGLLAPTGLPLRAAANLVVEGNRLLAGSAEILDAIKYYLDMTTHEIQIVQHALAILHRLVPDDEPRAVDLTPRQCPVQAFAKHFLVRDPNGDVSCSQLWDFFAEVAAAGEVEQLSRAEFLRVLPGAMAAVFDARKSHAIKRDGKVVRGFRGVTIREEVMPVEHVVIED